MNTLQVILVIVAVMAMLEAVWLLASPDSYKRIARLWLRVAAQVPTLLPILLAAIGIAIWGVVLIGQPLVVTLAILVGVFFVVAAGVYANQSALKRMAEQALFNRSTGMLRALAIIVFIVAALVLWAALTGN